ncbi:hypothetical protein AB0L10_22980 [Streptomyces flaveolus]
MLANREVTVATKCCKTANGRVCVSSKGQPHPSTGRIEAQAGAGEAAVDQLWAGLDLFEPALHRPGDLVEVGLTRNRAAAPYERAPRRAGALTAPVHAVCRSDRLGSRNRGHTVTVPAAPRPRLGPSRTDRKAGGGQERTTDVATLELHRRAFEAGAEPAAKPQDGIREGAVAHGPRPEPAPAPTTPHAQQPGGVVVGKGALSAAWCRWWCGSKP